MLKEKGFKFISEFKEFISKGNVIDLAVGVIIGSAFTGIVNSLVNDLVMPTIGYLIGGIHFQDFKLALPVAEGAEPVFIAYGMFIQNIVNFLIVAFVVFCMVKMVNSFRRKTAEPVPTPPEPEPSPELTALTEIRDLLRDRV